MATLSDHHQEQVSNFLKFAAHKRQEILSEVDVIFAETADTRLLSQQYSEDNVREILSSLQALLKADLSRELTHASYTNTLVLQQAFGQVEGAGLHFTIDVSQLENAELLGDMQEFEKACVAQREREQRLALGVGRRSNLATLTKDPSSHIDLIRRNNELEDEVRQWRCKYDTLKEQALKTAHQASNLGAERAGILEQLETMEHQAARGQACTPGKEPGSEPCSSKVSQSETLTMDQQLEKARAETSSALEELEILKRSFGEKIDQSKQFQQLRKMISTKNAQLKQVRIRLARYEQDDADIELMQD